jgi:hypothetical protein
LDYFFEFRSRTMGSTNFTENFQPSGVSRNTSVFELAPSSKAGSAPASSIAPRPLMTQAPGRVLFEATTQIDVLELEAA